MTNYLRLILKDDLNLYIKIGVKFISNNYLSQLKLTQLFHSSLVYSSFLMSSSTGMLYSITSC